MGFNVKPDPTDLLLSGILFCSYGAVLVLGRRLRLLPLLVLLVAIAAAVFGVIHTIMALPIHRASLLPIILGASLFAMVVRSRSIAPVFSRSAIFLASPVFSGGLLMAAGIVLVDYASSQSHPENELIDEVFDQQDGARDYQPIEDLHAVTDRGNAVPLFRLANAKAEALVKSDQRLLDKQGYQDHLIRISGPSAQTNCHGWVFTDGLCWISNESVAVILTDNGYHEVELPADGDLVVYRDEAGKIIHTGIVRGIFSEGRILVESKWGTLGAYVHFVEQSNYSGNWTFHHSIRTSHLLRGLPSTNTASFRKLREGS